MEQIIESKKDEIVEKVIDQLESKKEEINIIMDKSEEKIESAADELGKKLEDTVNSIIDKIDDNPDVAKVIDSVENIIATQLDGRDISCSCFGFLWSLRITRKSPPKILSKSEETLSKLKSQPALNIRTPV